MERITNIEETDLKKKKKNKMGGPYLPRFSDLQNTI